MMTLLTPGACNSKITSTEDNPRQYTVRHDDVYVRQWRLREDIRGMVAKDIYR